MNTLYCESVKILSEDSNPKPFGTREFKYLHTLVEDANSPVTRVLHERLFQQVLDKKHIDFGDIPKSQGDIKKYSGFRAMMDTLETIRGLAEDNDNKNVLYYHDIVFDAVLNLQKLADTYKKGFENKCVYTCMEYNSYVYLCVEATTALIYCFVDFYNDKSTSEFKLKIANNKLRADEFYFEQLKKFNTLMSKHGMAYKKTLESYINNDKKEFVGTTALGVGVTLGIIMAIIPLTREIVYQIYKSRAKLADFLETQANFLELNRASVEASRTFDVARKHEILKKQEKLASKLHKMSDKLRVSSAVGIRDKDRALKDDNKHLTLDSIRNDVSKSDFDIM